MIPKVTIPNQDTIWLTSQTGRPDFFETTLSIDIRDWQQLKAQVDDLLALRFGTESCCGYPLTADGRCRLSGEQIRKVTS